MFAFKYLLMAVGVGLMLTGISILAYDLWLMFQYRRAIAAGARKHSRRPNQFAGAPPWP